MDLITQTTAVLDVPPAPLGIGVNFCYNPADPLVVRMILIVEVHFASGAVARDATPWEYSRDLLDEAFSKPGVTVGVGDIKLTYLDPAMRGQCTCGLEEHFDPQHQLRVDLMDIYDDTYPVFIDAGPVIDFMAQSLRMVPVGNESLDIDGELAELLGEA